MKKITLIPFLFLLFFGSTAMAQCLQINVTNVNVDCHGQATGFIDITPNNGQAPYTYQWANPGFFPQSNTNSAANYAITGLAAGIYNITVTDNLGCDTVFSSTINEPATAIAVNAIVTSSYNGAQISCNSASDGEITATANGGTPSGGPGSGYTFLWNTGGNASVESGLPNGVYSVTAVDANGCSASTNVTLTEPSSVTASITSLVHATCHGGADGSATCAGSGGTGSSYAYHWANGQTTATGFNLPAGVHYITITDVNYCIGQTSVTISEPSALSLTVTHNNVSAQGQCDGDLTITASGGTPPYSYSIDNGVTFQSANPIIGLCAGNYDIVVIDASGCTHHDSVTIAAANAINLSFSNYSDTICFGSSTQILCTPLGGVPPYTYSWVTSSTNNPITVTTGGVYCLTVTDVNGITGSGCVTITEVNFDIQISNPILLGGGGAHIFAGDSYAFQTTSAHPTNTTYTWTPGAGLNCTTCSNPVAAPAATTTYHVQGIHNTHGCVDQDSATIHVYNNDPTDTVYLEVAPDSTVIFCTNLAPFLSGNSGTSSATTTPNYGSIVNGLQYGCFEYTSNGTAPEVIDTVYWVNCDQLCDTTIVYITTTSCVWPGDTDYDGVANNFDLLPIGLHHSATGTTRNNASINYTCQPSLDWGTGVTSHPAVDIKNVDTDGNGTINDLDTNAIVANWSLTHARSGSLGSPSGADIYIDTATVNPGDTVSLPIVLGTNAVPTSGYGVAFTINYDPAGVDSGSVSIDYSNSWLGTVGTNMIGIHKDFPNVGMVEVGMTRIDHTPISGGGTIGYINLTIKDDVLPRSNSLRLDFNISNVRFIDYQGNIIPTNPLPSQILVEQVETNTNSIQAKSNRIAAFPNPTTGHLNITSTDELLESIQITDLTGRIVLETQNINQQRQTVDLSQLPVGIYTVTITTPTEHLNTRVIKK